MNPESNGTTTPYSALTDRQPNHRLEQSAFYVLLATVILAPLAFWPSSFVSLDLVKAVIISVGTLAGAILYGILALKEKKIALPPRSLSWTSVLLVISLVVSSLASIHAMKSLFGQGFETGTASFVAILLLAALAAFAAVSRDRDRAFVVYAGVVAAFLILFIFHAARLAFGPGFATLGFLNSAASSPIGSWAGLGSLSAVVALVALAGIAFLPSSRAMKGAYWALAVLAGLGMYAVASPKVWGAEAVALLVLTVLATLSRQKEATPSVAPFMRRLAWVPFLAFLVSTLFAWKGTSLAAPATRSLGIDQGTQLTLSWQYTLDVASDSIKNFPIFGVGPNHFAQAFIAFKPAQINMTDAWSNEFSFGFGLIPTFVATQGLVGACLWLLLLVFYAIFGIRSFRRLSSDPLSRFTFISSFAASIFLLGECIISVPPHAIVFLAFVTMGMTAALGMESGGARPFALFAHAGTARIWFKASLILLIVIAAAWAFMVFKKTVALAYFGSGLKQLTVAKDPLRADADFARSISFDEGDIYWQARAEASLSKASMIAAGVNQSSNASTTQAALNDIATIVNSALGYSRNAIAYDPTNYYNFLSEARVSETAANFHLTNGYENAVRAYGQAISLNPQNPSIYLALARLQASQNKLDDALKSVGAAIQVKDNYLDAIFAYSQIEAAKGDLPNAIIAAQIATQINPQNPLLFFQLGLLQYNNKDYASSADALSKAVSLQPNYANAQYFLGLSFARIGKNAEAVKQFSDLAASNPDNQEVALILANLRAGKSPFTDAKPPVTPSPEKRSSLPIKQKQK